MGEAQRDPSAMDAEAAGSVAPSESHNSSGQQQEESLQQGGSVNWGQATAQSPVSRGLHGRV